jgi:hypothetical protein
VHATKCNADAACPLYILVGGGRIIVLDVCLGSLSDLESFRIPQVVVPPPRREPSSPSAPVNKYLRGPIPLSWLTPACALRGRNVLAVSLARWFQSGLRGRKHGLELSTNSLRDFGVANRMAKSRALDALENAGLVRVEGRPGRNPLVTLLAGPDGWIDGEFLRGPIPLLWLGQVCRLPGQRVLAVALAIWFRAGVEKRKHDLKVTTALLKRFAVTDRSAKTRALAALERAGLGKVDWQPRRNPRVTIIEDIARAAPRAVSTGA